MSEKIKIDKEELKKRLSAEQYKITQEKATEPAFTGKYNTYKENGIYKCVVCDNELFSSETKYDSGSGWPSFFQPINEDAVAFIEDNSYGMKRVEVVCAKCDSHLGHVFEDGPKPTGMRFCMNSASLDFEKK